MKLPPFTLIYQPGTTRKTAPRRKAGAAGNVVGLKSFSLATPASMKTMRPGLRRALWSSRKFFDDEETFARFIDPITIDLKRQTNVETVGFWDIASQVGELPRVIEVLNRAQPAFTFFDVQANTPSGMIGRPERAIAWAEGKLKRALDPDEQVEIADNHVIFEDFVMPATRIREALDLDYLIGLAPAKVAFEEKRLVHWNYFSVQDSDLVLASTFDIARFAKAAKRPFEVAVADVAIASLLALVNPDLKFHDETRGCLFDFNEARDTIVESLRAQIIEDTCMERIRPKYQSAAQAMIRALREFGTPSKSSPPDPAASRPSRKRAPVVTTRTFEQS